LDEWVHELDGIDTVHLKAHLLRTRRALGGMGSIADVVICPQAGHNISNDKSTIKAANDRLLELTKKLDADVTHRLAVLPE
jgi:hypothetical protein